jgi:hypothetical protein
MRYNFQRVVCVRHVYKMLHTSRNEETRLLSIEALYMLLFMATSYEILPETCKLQGL